MDWLSTGKRSKPLPFYCRIAPRPGKMCFFFCNFAIKKAPANCRSENKNFICKFEMHPFTQVGCIVSIYGTQVSKRVCQWLPIHFWKHLRTNRASYPFRMPFPLFVFKCQSCQLHIPFTQPVNSIPPISKSTTQLSTIFHNRPVSTYP